MNKLIDIFAKWEPFGQAIFILIIFAGIMTLIRELAHYLVILIRGYSEKNMNNTEKKI